MKKKLIGVLLLTSFVGAMGSVALSQVSSPAPATASATPNPQIAAIDAAIPAPNVEATVADVFADIAAGKVTMAVASLVLLCTYFFRKYFVDTGKLGSGSLPWVSVGLSIAFGLASNVLLGATPAAAASAVLLSGPIASHLWSSILKLVVSKA